jgi:tetratricopeptide (TPR) repeat protein
MRYSAFISYNHRDARWARWLHRSLETYGVPKRLWGRPAPFGTIAARLPPVFRDRDELASSADLAASVQQALGEAATLVVLCTPQSAKSRWVNAEVTAFIESGRGHRIMCIIFEGEPHSVDPELECLPPALLAEGAPEPLAADARPQGDGRRMARLKVLAGILDVPFDELRQREAHRRQRRLLYLAAASTAGLVFTTALAVFALISRAEAVDQRKIAERRTLTAERTLEFVKSMFRVADPSEARGETMTAREVVDRGARQLETGLTNEPTVRTELGVTLAEVYGALGLYTRSDALIGRTLQIRQDDKATEARQYAALGESKFRLGDYPAALMAFARAAGVVPRSGAEPLISRILVGIGTAQSALGNEAAADRALQNALAIDRARGMDARIDVARDLEALGVNKYFLGDLDQAHDVVSQALVIRLQIEGPLSPDVAGDRNTLAAIAHDKGDIATAEALYRANVAADEKVLGPAHPDLAITLNNLGRMVLEQRRFGEAEVLLDRAIRISVAARGAEHDDMAFLYSNLALAKRYLGQPELARQWFAKALQVARRTRHQYLGPILADTAALECATGHRLAGLRYLDEAKPLVAENFQGQPWRSAWLENVRGECLLGDNRTAGQALIRHSSPVILKRWNRDTLFGFEAGRRNTIAGTASGTN